MIRLALRSAAMMLGIVATVAFLDGAEHRPAANAPDHAILILRNGQIIEGRITRSEGAYAVNLGDGQIHIKNADVELVCNSLEEGYQQKRAAIQQGNVHHHLQLAQWCVRHGLLEHAGNEVADARRAEPANPMVGVMEHRLKMAREPSPTADTARKTSAGPTNEELDRMIRSLPHGAVEGFTQSVQPVLMNQCATSGCHGPQAESGLRLFRVSTGKSASRRITQRNLFSVLPYVDQENPAGSRLLTVPASPHGTASHAIFNEHQTAQYKRVADWVAQLGRGPVSESPPTLMLASPAAPAPVQIPPQMLSQETKDARPLLPTKTHEAGNARATGGPAARN